GYTRGHPEPRRRRIEPAGSGARWAQPRSGELAGASEPRTSRRVLGV
ncbi:MAG: hypothetical protein AVDCRST_MAG42-2935, partial [uncultured Chthoniobacterales bacterium]